MRDVEDCEEESGGMEVVRMDWRVGRDVDLGQMLFVVSPTY